MANPVIQREFFGILRSPKALAVLCVLTALFSISVLMRWPSDASVDISGQQSLVVFRVFGYGLLAGVVFLVPAFPATSIVNEKNSGTLALLFNSPLSSPSIYMGKLSGIFLFSLLVLFCSLPASAACYATGGIDLVNELGMLYLVLVMLIIQYATIGMLVSSYVQSADAGVRITYFIVLGLLFVTLMPSLLLRGTSLGLLGTLAEWLRYLSPLPAITEIMRQSNVDSDGLQRVSSAGGFIVASALMSVMAATVTMLRLNHRIFDRSRAQGVITNDRSMVGRLWRRLVYVVDPQRRKAGIPWYLNPVMVKEFRSRRFGRVQWLLRLVSICAVASIVLTFMAATSITSWGVDRIGGLMVVLQVVLVVLLTPSLASGLISGERDSGGWELLRMTPLSSLKIVRGKILSVVWTLALVLMATLPGYLLLIWLQPTMWLQVYLVLICLAWTAVYAIAVSAAVGSLFRSTALSTTVTYVVVTGLFLVPILVWLGRDAPFGHSTVETMLLVNPVGAALSVIEAPGFAGYNLIPLAWWIAAIVSVAMFSVLGLQVWRLSRAE